MEIEETITEFEKAFEGRLFDPEQLPAVFAYQLKIFKYDQQLKKEAGVINR